MEVCPVPGCTWSGSTGVCPQHQRHGVPQAQAARFEDAPLLGHAIQDRYVLDGFVGGGAMGAVYRATDRRLGRVVAIKVMLNQATATPIGRERFAREARALSALRSVNSVTVHDFGVVEEGPLAGVAYMIMELLDGQTLQSRTHGRRLPPAEVVEILRQIARSLEEAHGAGIVHRDLKPGNVLLSTQPDGQRLVKVIDFGIARVADSNATGTDAVIGTPLYMAPEQCQAANVDHRADIYAVAAMTYHMLAGRPPFVADTPLAILMLHVNAPVPDLPDLGYPQWAALNQVVRQGLAKDPAQRPASVEAFVHAFAAAAQGAPLDVGVAETVAAEGADSLTPPPPRTAVEEAPRRRSYGAAAIVGVVATVAVVAALVTTQSPSEVAPAVTPVDPPPVDFAAPDAAVDAAPPDATPPPPDAAPDPTAELTAAFTAAIEGRRCPVAKAVLTQLELEPGRYQIQVTAPKHTAADSVVAVRSADVTNERVALVPIQVATTAPPPPDRTWPVAGMIAGGALLAAGGVMHGLNASLADELDGDRANQGLRDEVDLTAYSAIGAYAAGGAVFTASLVWFLTADAPQASPAAGGNGATFQW